MEWFYAVGDKQMGPVNEEEFKRLAAAGTIRPDTLVWRAGLDNWRPYREVTAAAASAQPDLAMAATSSTLTGGGAAGSVVCRECGKIFPPEEVVKFGDAFVCATCKPVYVQRMREGVSGGGAAGSLTEAELLARDYDVEVGEGVSHGWELFKHNAGLLIAVALIVGVSLVVINLIPYLSLPLSLLLTGPLMAGAWKVYIQATRGEETGVGDVFSGFSASFWQLVLCNIVVSVFSFLCMLPMFITMAVFFGYMFFSSQPPQFDASVSGAALLLFFGTLLLGIIGTLVISTLWLYALPLVIDKRLSFWSALQLSRKMVMKHFWMTLLLVIVWGLLLMVGGMMCLVGILVTGPVGFAAVAWHYNRIFGDLTADNA